MKKSKENSKIEQEKVETKKGANVNNENTINNEKTNKKGIKNKVQEIYKGIFKSPAKFEEILTKWLKPTNGFAFLVAIIVGIITHLTFLTETIMAPDGLWNSICYSEPGLWEISLGRWGIYFADKIVNNIAIPSIVGIVSIVLVAISAMFIVDILKLKNKITVFLVASAMVVVPSLTGTLLYIYTAVAYCVSMLLSVITVECIFKKKNRVFYWILGLAIFVFSLGIYQSYIGVLIGLTMIRLIRDLFDNDEKISQFFIHGIVLVVIVIVGGLLYSSVTNVILEKFELEQASYKGMDSISVSNTLQNLGTSIPKIYTDFADFYFNDNIIKNTNYSRDTLYKCLFLSLGILELILLISSKIWKKPLKLIFVILLTIALPIGLNSILLLTTETTTYILTSAQLILIIPYIAMIIEISGDRLTWLFKWSSILLMFFIVFTYYLADNTSYYVVNYKYNQAYATTQRIVDRIEQTEGYTPNTPILINGIFNDSDMDYLNGSDLYEYTLGSIFDIPIFHGTYSGMEGTWSRFLNIYLGYRVQFCNVQQYVIITSSQEFYEMGIFPSADSVKMIDNVIVVKITEDTILPPT